MAFDYLSPGGRRFFGSPAEFIRWAFYPYGAWTTANGREVLFNRFYEPIWQRRSDGAVEPANNKEWVKDIVDQKWFYTDASNGDGRASKKAKGGLVLRAWGLSEPTLDMAKSCRLRTY